MILVLTEKPSAARNFAKALGGGVGTYAGEQYKICALRGHVLELLPPEKQVSADKSELYKKWSLEQLPWSIDDLNWKKGIKKDCKSILNELQVACASADEVAIATDNDPSGEGELLAWEALEWCGWSGKTTRMFFVDEAPASIQKAFANRVPIASMQKDGDYIKALVRARWDFCSMQFVRAATCIAKQAGFDTVVRQGRLKSVMVALVGKQLNAYNNYVKKPFFEVRFKDENGNVYARNVNEVDTDDIRFDSPEKTDIATYATSAVIEDSRTIKHTSPGKLLDLARLSAILAKVGHRPEVVLSTYQKMYENQIVSYPRTEDKEITPEQFDELLPYIDKIASVVSVDPAILTHRTPRKTHVKLGGSHGANRPGTNVPNNLSDLNEYGEVGKAIYRVLARNYLAMFAEDFEYVLIKGHLADYPNFIGETKVPTRAGFKAIFDNDAITEEIAEGTEADNTHELGKVAEPYIYEGANKRPQKPTMKWLTSRLEKYNVGTGATRTSTLAEISKCEPRALISEHKGTLALTPCGEVSFVLLDGCHIASPEATEQLFESMQKVGRFEEDPARVLNTVTQMVVHDRNIMAANKTKLSGLKGLGAPTVGTCPLCDEALLDKGRSLQCASNKFKKEADGSFALISGCGFRMFKSAFGKKLTDTQIKQLLANGSTNTKVKGLTSQKTGQKFNAILALDKQTGRIMPVFDK